MDRSLDGSGIYPPVGILPSLSRLMKDGIGAEFTRDDHKGLSDQLFAAYAKTMEARSLASVIGEEELATSDKRYIAVSYTHLFCTACNCLLLHM